MISLLGWIGTLTYLINHTYISVNKNWQRKIYYTGNCFAAILLVISSYYIGSYQAVFINGFWAIISIALLAGVPIKSIPVKTKYYVVMLAMIILYIFIDSALSQKLNTVAMGWSSAFVFTIGYLLFCSEKLSQTHYLLGDAYAALVLLPQLWFDHNWPVFVLEISWATISLYGVYMRKDKIHLID